MGPIASQYPEFFSCVVQYTVRRALYAKGNRVADGLENQSEKYAFKNPAGGGEIETVSAKKK